MRPHDVTREFEAALCQYTGAPYAVAVTSCTMALLLACAWHIKHRVVGYRRDEDGNERPYYENQYWDGRVRREGFCNIEIPKRTYVSVPQSIIHAGGRPAFRDENWLGDYQLKPLPVWDSARWFTGGMYNLSKQFVCLSFHASKTLGDTQGGAILHDNKEADAWFRRARFDGRTEGVHPRDDKFDVLGWHCYLSADVSARLLWKLSVLPRYNAPLPNDDYPDLSQIEIFR